MDAAPFAAWLASLPGTAEDKATATGLGVETVRRFLAPEPPQGVYLDTVDRATLTAGIPLGALYPDF